MSFLKSITYFFWELFTQKSGVKRKINGYQVRFPARWCRYYENDYESENYSFLKKQVSPEMHIIDIGAHIGLFSVISSQLTGSNGRVISFEPTPGTFEILQKTLEINKCRNVVPVQAAVSSEIGKANFYISDIAGCNSNSLVKNKEEDQLKSYEVKLMTIDGVIKEFSLKPSIIKIDAEGAELDVLKGGKKTLLEIKPVLILGLHPDFIKEKGDTLDEIWDLLREYGYMISNNGRNFAKSDFVNQKLIFDVHCF